jgi:hypothetical protein
MKNTHSMSCIRLGGLLAFGLCFLMSVESARATAPTPISACGTINVPGNYAVTKNLTASGDCLTLTVSNVAIDLQGHKITGDGTGDGITDGGNNIAFIVVANGAITNFDTGIELTTFDSQTSDLILNVSASGNAADGIDIAGRDNNLSGVIASLNGGDGIVLGDCCDSLFNVITNGNHLDGVNFADEDYLLNVISNGNSGNGVTGFSDSFVVNSVANKNHGNGLDLQEGDDFVVSSLANHNQGDGMHFSAFNQATDSKASGNQGNGILAGEFSLVTSVVTNKNAGDGVDLTCPGNAVRVSAKGNTGTNLDDPTTGNGPCTNVRNKAQ